MSELKSNQFCEQKQKKELMKFVYKSSWLSTLTVAWFQNIFELYYAV